MTNVSAVNAITAIIKYLIFSRLKGLTSETVLVILRHITRKILIDTAIYHRYTQAAQPYSFSNQGPGFRFDKDEIPTGRITMLTKMSFPVINI